VPSGICHTFTEDGRCVSLLKILFTNHCIYDCAYCVSRSSNDIPRAAFTVNEIVSLTIDFYRRNYIEGLFLSSGIMRSPDDTMERLVRTAKTVRDQGFNGYIHLKCVPHASRDLIRRAGLYADRLSVNIELPSEKSLRLLTREKTYASVLEPMGVIRETIAETREHRRRLRHVPQYASAGQSTQLIIGASPESDFDILNLANRLYHHQSLKRVYYSAYVPVGDVKTSLQKIAEPPLQRENRLYQADWLIRLYGFSLDDVISSKTPYLDLNLDPKQAFALRHPWLFPIDINTADRQMILRVPGIGLKSANRIVSLRRSGRLRLEHLKQIGIVVSRALPYLQCDGLPNTQWSGANPVNASSVAKQPKKHLVGSHGDTPVVFVTDGTFEGLLTAIFEAYERKSLPDAIEIAGQNQLGLFQRLIRITTDPDKSDRVWKGLEKFLGSKRRRMIFEAYLSGCSNVETTILKCVWRAIPNVKESANRIDLKSFIEIENLSRKVQREAHRLKGFIRFQQTGEDQYFALIAPQYDVLVLLRQHFEARFADQRWIIYDRLRNYGICYDRQQVRELQLNTADLKVIVSKDRSDEQVCQMLWKRYYDAINIRHRHNPRLHVRQLPRRFWQYLPEKQK
jgi:probable DNA metabolism protein